MEVLDMRAVPDIMQLLESWVKKLASSTTTTTSGTSQIGQLVVALACAVGIAAAIFLRWNSNLDSKVEKKKDAPVVMIKRSSASGSGKTAKRGPICPYTKDTKFEIETAEHLPPSPMDLFEQQQQQQQGDGELKHPMPLAARWLAAGLSGQDTPGMLRAGLKRLRNSDHFLVEELPDLKTELLLKRNNLDNPQKHPLIFVAEPQSLKAQQECLELFLDFLPKRYPKEYVYNREANTMKVNCIDTTFAVADWWDTRPLELCERIVQEDLILMRPDSAYFEQQQVADEQQDDMVPLHTYYMSAAAVVFSFNELQEKLGKPIIWIHAPVPNFEQHIAKTVNSTFSRLDSTKPMWRNNWGIAPSGTLDEPLYGSTAAQEHRNMTTVSQEEVKSKWLKVEYQTIRRLPESGYVLFTVKTMADPLSSLQHTPEAATCLAKSIRGMSSKMHQYKGIENDETCQAILDYLDSLSN